MIIRDDIGHVVATNAEGVELWLAGGIGLSKRLRKAIVKPDYI